MNEVFRPIIRHGITRVFANKTFSPASIFSAGAVGAWFEPSDINTLFQNTSGTTPVTAPGQSVALALDKSQGAGFDGTNFTGLGSELIDTSVGPVGNAFIQRGTLTDAGGGYWQVAGNNALPAVLASDDPLLTIGKSYLVTLDVSAASGTNLSIYQSNAPNSGLLSPPFLSRTSPGVSTAVIVASRDTLTISGPTNGNSATFKTSVRELPGNHAIQGTAANQPLYAVRPATGIRNILEYTEQFDNAYWSTKTNVTLTEVFNITPPIAGQRVWKMEAVAAGAVDVGRTLFSSTQGTFSGFLKAGSFAGVAEVQRTNSGARTLVDLTTGAVTNPTGALNSNFGAEDLADDWFRPWATTVNTSPGLFRITFTAAAAGEFIYITGAQLEAPIASPNPATAYQKVVTRAEITEAGVPSLSYLSNVSSDSLNWIAAAGDYTIAYGGASGTVILDAQTLSGSTDIMQSTEVYEYVAVDRPLGSAERRRLQDYLDQKST